MTPKKKRAMSDRLSMCAHTLHQWRNVPVADTMDINKYPQILLTSPVQLCSVMPKNLWMRTCMIFIIRTKEDLTLQLSRTSV